MKYADDDPVMEIEYLINQHKGIFVVYRQGTDVRRALEIFISSVNAEYQRYLDLQK